MYGNLTLLHSARKLLVGPRTGVLTLCSVNYGGAYQPV